MIINVGSQNKLKIAAVKKTIRTYDLLSDAKVRSIDAPSGVAEYPRSIGEIVLGARNRAINSFRGCDYSFGLQAGLVEDTIRESEFLNVCACLIYDGKNSYYGLSPAFRIPYQVSAILRAEKTMTLDRALRLCKFAGHEKIDLNGCIGAISGGKINRIDYLAQGVMMALIDLINNCPLK